MTLVEKIEALCRNFARKLSQDLKASLEQALKEGQPKRNTTQEASLNFTDEIKVTDSAATIRILATDEYWINIEEGRGAGKKAPPSDVVGKKWQNKNNIDPRVVLKEIEIKYKQKKGLSTTPQRNLSKQKKQLSYDEAAKQLSYIFAGVIGKRGIVPKPFVDRVLNDGRLKELTKAIGELTKQQISTELNLNNEFKKIKVTV